MVEVKVDDNVDVWVPSVIVKELGNRKSFVVKSLKNLTWNDGGGEEPKPNITVDSSSIRLPPPTVSVKSFGLMESVEVFIDPGWRPGMVKSILSDERYTVCLKATNQSLVLKHDAIRPSQETIAKLFLQNTSEVNAPSTPQTSLNLGENGEKEVPDEHIREEDENRKRKRGEVEHTPVLSEAAATESVSSLTATALEQTEAGTEEISSRVESSEEVNNNQMLKVVVLPFAKKESSLWKELETKEVFQRAPQNPHFSPLVGETEVFREALALAMMLTFSKLVESFKDLEPDVPVSQLDSFRESLAKLQKHGFDISAPLARINKLLALKDKQLKEVEEKKGLDRQIMALKQEFMEMEHKILELESCARDRGVVLDNLESEFKATSSASWGEA
ncbi:hypothetical protein HA466_0191470 [Hirschfeldia incana]|nr:hypothetical protein HA466_0191470 [Hirschfeldia incana]